MYGTHSPSEEDEVRTPILPSAFENVDRDNTTQHEAPAPQINDPFDTAYQRVGPQSYTDVPSTSESPSSSTVQLKELPSPPLCKRKTTFFARNTGWRPATLKLPFLLFFAFVTILMIIGAELTLRRSQAHGALVFTSEANDAIEYLVNYGPLAIGVLYGILYVSIDHNVKRLEPYFQLSKPGGVTAEHSLLLEYPYVLTIAAPFIAVRKRHWVVLTSSMILLTITYGITPLMSTILAKEPNVQRTSNFEIKRASLLPVDAQRDSITTSFSYIGYSHQYLNGGLPEFTQSDYAALPFESAVNTDLLTGEEWTAKSTIYKAHLDCKPGIVEFFNSTVPQDPQIHNQTRVSTQSGDCKFLVGSPRGQYSQYSPYSIMFFNKGLWEREVFDPDTTQPLYNSSGCQSFDDCTIGPSGLYQMKCEKDYLIGFFGRRAGAKENATPGNWTKWDQASATFCLPVHEQQEAEIVVDARTHAIKQMKPLGETSNFTGIDVDHWTNLIAGFATSAPSAKFNVSGRKWYPELGQASPMMGMAGWSMPDHTSELVRNPAFQTYMENYKVPVDKGDYVYYDYVNYTLPINTYMVMPRSITPFGLGKQNDVESLLDPQNLGSMYSDAYKYLFAMLIQPELATFNSDAETAEAQRRYNATGYVADATWIRLLQSALLVILALNILLAILLFRRRCDIGGDPGSIASAMASVDTCVLEQFQDAEFMATKDVTAILKANGHRYCLRNGRVMICKEGETSETERSVTPTLNRAQVTLSKPLDLTLSIGILAVVILILWIILLIVLFQKNRSQQGFGLPGNGFWFNVYANYLPTTAATALEAFLVLLASSVALLYPFKTLTRGYADARISLGVNYDLRPPHLQTIAALRVRNIMLAVLSIAILLANVLAVALGGLFNKELIQHQRIGEVVLEGSVDALEKFDSQALIGSDNVVDAEFFYVGTGGMLQFERRPWTTDELFYIPFLDPKSNSSAANYTVEAVGLGVNITCEPIPAEAISIWNSPEGTDNNSFVWTSFRYDANTPISMPKYRYTDDLREGTPTTQKYPLINIGGIWNVGTFGFWNNSIQPEWYFELAPQQYPEKLAETSLDFWGSWTKYERKFGNITIDRVWWYNATMGKTIEGPIAYMAKNVSIQCRPRPRIVRRKITANLEGLVINDNEAPESDETLSADFVNQHNETGLSGLLTSFHTMVLRGTWKEGVQFLDSLEMFEATAQYGSKNLTDPRPSNWLTLNLEQEATKSNPDFDLYSYPEESARSMAAVYTKLFAIYLQLHGHQVFAADQRSAETAETVYWETRIVMAPVAVYVAVALLSLFIPAIVAVYFSMYSAFTVHAPTTLAGLYASFHASSVVHDVRGTETIRNKERRKRLEMLGNTYGYGWYLGKDGGKHVGIEKEPLLGRRSDHRV
ncbi:hypothetical protein FN846DRAFT_949711 [Sphaerosporella brunnea]|uniref:Uncharacterized protein n=1 Tax=Sphaerosporella brunnea TaxID=1250544 RepID=A0A5J5EWU0_9PEZI|nr:hypothetical protein FN846DRAFT_949711 [Sphaerosporella brunnea]